MDSKRSPDGVTPTWYLVVMGAVLISVGAVVWQQQQPRVPRTEKVLSFAELPVAQQEKVLRDPEMWFLKFDRAVAKGELKLSRPTTFSPGRFPGSGAREASRVRRQPSYMALEVEKKDLQAITEWVAKNLPPSLGAISLTAVVINPHWKTDSPTARGVYPQEFLIDASGVYPVLPPEGEKNQPWHERMARAVEAGELEVSGYPQISPLDEGRRWYGVFYAGEEDVAAITEWVRKQLPAGEAEVRVSFWKMKRVFMIDAKGVREITR